MPHVFIVPPDKLKATVLDGRGEVSGQRDLPASLFGGPVNVPLMHQVVTAQLAAARRGTANTRTRSEVRGGGSKPWRQKGTGRARHGSIRSPLWVGGGTVFGPHPRDYSQRTPRKMRKGALRSALGDKALAGAIYVLDGFGEPKTKAAAALLAAAGLDGKVLLVHAPQETSSALYRAFRNLPKVTPAPVGSLAAYDVLVADAIVFSSEAFEAYCGRAVAEEELRLEEGSA